jgi:predicted lipid carrier protein YhbT
VGQVETVLANPILELDPSSYLREVLPALLRSAQRPALPKAVIQFVIVDRPDCDLAYRCSPAGLEVMDGIVDDVDLTLSFVTADLLAFAKKKLDVPRALRSQRLKVYGRTELLEWMTARLVDAATGGVS